MKSPIINKLIWGTLEEWIAQIQKANEILRKKKIYKITDCPLVHTLVSRNSVLSWLELIVALLIDLILIRSMLLARVRMTNMDRTYTKTMILVRSFETDDFDGEGSMIVSWDLSISGISNGFVKSWFKTRSLMPFWEKLFIECETLSVNLDGISKGFGTWALICMLISTKKNDKMVLFTIQK